MPLINCKIKLNLTWKKECVLSTDDGEAVFIINDTKFVMAYNKLAAANDDQFNRDSKRVYFLPRNDLNKYNVIIDGRNIYDNSIESDIEKYRELKKVMIGKGEDYTTGSLLDYDLSKQKELEADPRAIQEMEFKYMLPTNSTIYWVLEKSKETILEFYQGNVNVY